MMTDPHPVTVALGAIILLAAPWFLWQCHKEDVRFGHAKPLLWRTRRLIGRVRP